MAGDWVGVGTGSRSGCGIALPGTRGRLCRPLLLTTAAVTAPRVVKVLTFIVRVCIVLVCIVRVGVRCVRRAPTHARKKKLCE